MKRFPYLYSFLLAIVPVLSMASKNINQININQILFPLFVSLSVAIVVFFGIHIFSKDIIRTGLCSSIIIMSLLNYGRLFENVWEKHVLVTTIFHHLIAGFVLILIVFVLCRWIWKHNKPFENLSIFLNTIAFILVMLCFLQIGNGLLKERVANTFPTFQNSFPVETAVLHKNEINLPNIYYIILDGYAREDKLKEYYDFDNSLMMSELRKRGFYIASKSNSNYAQTFLSLSSSLNGKYLQEEIIFLQRQFGTGTKERKLFYQLIQNNRVGQYLKKKGYQYITLLTNWGGTGKSKISDFSFEFAPFLGSEFVNVFLRSTVFRFITPGVADAHRFSFAALKDEKNLFLGYQPFFAFFHLLLPHNPYVFDKYGNERTNIPLSLQWEMKTGGWNEKNNYIEQLIFVNQQIITIIDNILAKYKNQSKQPIIILQADHGSASSMFRNPKENVPSPDERLSIFNAILAPPDVQKSFYPEMSPVNTFRILFNALFDESFEILKDESYFSWYSKPYVFKKFDKESN